MHPVFAPPCPALPCVVFHRYIGEGTCTNSAVVCWMIGWEGTMRKNNSLVKQAERITCSFFVFALLHQFSFLAFRQTNVHKRSFATWDSTNCRLSSLVVCDHAASMFRTLWSMRKGHPYHALSLILPKKVETGLQASSTSLTIQPTGIERANPCLYWSTPLRCFLVSHESIYLCVCSLCKPISLLLQVFPILH